MCCGFALARDVLPAHADEARASERSQLMLPLRICFCAAGLLARATLLVLLLVARVQVSRAGSFLRDESCASERSQLMSPAKVALGRPRCGLARASCCEERVRTYGL